MGYFEILREILNLMGQFEIPWEYKSFQWDILKSHGIFIFTWEHKCPMGKCHIPIGFYNIPWENKYSHVMGKFKFSWELIPLLIIISPARCERVKSRVVLL